MRRFFGGFKGGKAFCDSGDNIDSQQTPKEQHFEGLLADLRSVAMPVESLLLRGGCACLAFQSTATSPKAWRGV